MSGVADYLKSTNLKEVVTEVINLALAERDSDCYGVMARLFAERAQPMRPMSILARTIPDTRAGQGIQCDIRVKHLGREFVAATASAPFVANNGKQVADAVKELNAIRGVPELTFDDGTNYVISAAIAKATARTTEKELFDVLGDPAASYTMPRCLFCLIDGGYFRLYASPRVELPFPDQIRMGTELYATLGQSLPEVGALGGRVLRGSIDAGFAAIRRAGELCIYEPGVDFHIYGDFGAAARFMMLKQEGVREQKGVEIPLIKYYDVEGVRKTAEEWAQIVAEILQKHGKTIIGLTNVFEERDEAGRATLPEFPIGEIEQVHLLKGDIRKMVEEAKGRRIMAYCSQVDVLEDAPADAAIAMGAQFVSFGAPSPGERTMKWQRLLRIYEVLHATNRLTKKV